MGGLDGQNKPAYSSHQVLPLCPDEGSSGPPADAGVYERSEDISNWFFSESSEGSRDPEFTEGERARNAFSLLEDDLVIDQ